MSKMYEREITVGLSIDVIAEISHGAILDISQKMSGLISKTK